MASPLGVGSGGGAEKLGEGAVKRVVQVAQREVEKKANKVFANTLWSKSARKEG